jgi:hypothetical protein
MYVIKDEMDHINVRKLQKLYRYFAIRSDPGWDLEPNDFYGSGSIFDLGTGADSHASDRIRSWIHYAAKNGNNKN